MKENTMIKKIKKINTKYIVAIIMSLIIGSSILGYGYLDYKYKTNRDLQNLEAVVTPINIPTLEPTNTPEITEVLTNNLDPIKPEPTNASDIQIDCIGPDGKHFQTTEIECKEFNDAWNKPKIPTAKPTSNYIYTPSNNNTYIPYVSNYTNYSTSDLSNVPNPLEEYETQRKQKCMKDTIEYGTCIAEYNLCLSKNIGYCSNMCSKPYCSY